MVIFIVWIVHHLEQKNGLNHIKEYFKIEVFAVLECLLKKYDIKVYAILKNY